MQVSCKFATTLQWICHRLLYSVANLLSICNELATDLSQIQKIHCKYIANLQWICNKAVTNLLYNCKGYAIEMLQICCKSIATFAIDYFPSQKNLRRGKKCRPQSVTSLSQISVCNEFATNFSIANLSNFCSGKDS